MIIRNALVVGIALLVVLAVLPAPTAGSSHFDASVSPSIDVPDRAVTFEGDEYPVTELGRVQRGEPIHATVDVDEDTRAALLLLDEDHNVVDGDDGTGDGEVAFPTGDLQPGTYVVVLRVDGEIYDIVPVVVSAYDVSADAPGEVTEGSTMEVTAELTALESADAPYRVRAVVGSGQEELRTTLTKESGTTYAGTVDTSGLPAGTYTLYVIAEEIEEVFDGEKGVLGASDARTFSVAASSGGSGGGSGGGSSGGGSGGGSSGGGSGGGSSGGGGSGGGSSDGGGGSGGGGGGGSGGGASTATPAGTTPGGTPTAGTATPTGGQSGTTATGTPTAGADTNTAGTTDGPDGTATEASPTAPGTSSPGQPLGVLPAVVGVLLAALIALRRDRSA